jgi:phosphatidylglycerophosphatase A
MKNFLIKLLATGTYTGYSPFAPGTVGTLWAVIIAYFLSGAGPLTQAAVIVIVCAASIYIAGEAIEIFGRKDPSEITIDEVAGGLVAFFLIPFTPFNAILVFLIFRFFDIVKPYPAGLIDRRLTGGAGVVLDDVASGVYTLIIAHIILWLLA